MQVPLAVFVKHDKLYSFAVAHSSSVVCLKQAIAVKMSMPPAQQMLIFGGKILVDSCTLVDYGVQVDSTIFLQEVTGASRRRTRYRNVSWTA